MSASIDATLTAPTSRSAAYAPRVDARGPRFGAVVTTGVLATSLLLLNEATVVAAVLLTVQALAFGLGAVVGIHAQPYGIVFRKFMQPRLAAPTEFEDVRPPRFAQAVGLAFAVVALAALVAGADTVALGAVSAALAAAFLNAAFRYCLGCEMYLLVVRIRSRFAR